jgi:hypothetical protein
MPPSSSISSSRPRAFGLAFVASAVVVVGACIGVVLVTKALGRKALPNQTLLELQLAKIGHGPAPDIVFLGDSSLGNAISAEEWSRLTSGHALNLALSGSYGYVGSYNMLRRVLDWHAPRHVIIMQTAEMMRRPVSEESYLLTAPGLSASLVSFFRLTMSVQQVASSLRWLTKNGPNLAFGRPLPPESREAQIVNGYVRQAAERTPDQKIVTWTPSSINPQKIKYLAKIGDLCKSHGLDCIYMHGPLGAKKCRAFDAYFEEVARLITAQGLRMVQTRPICVPEAELGDSDDHVRPDLKNLYTRKHYQLLAPRTRG